MLIPAPEQKENLTRSLPSIKNKSRKIGVFIQLFYLQILT